MDTPKTRRQFNRTVAYTDLCCNGNQIAAPTVFITKTVNCSCESAVVRSSAGRGCMRFLAGLTRVFCRLLRIQPRSQAERARRRRRPQRGLGPSEVKRIFSTSSRVTSYSMTRQRRLEVGWSRFFLLSRVWRIP